MRALLGLIFVAIMLLLYDWDTEKGEPYFREFLNAGHFPLMAAISALIYFALREDKGVHRLEAMKLSLLLSLIFIFVTEVVQPLVGRSAEIQDIVRGTLGALWGLGFILILKGGRREWAIFAATSIALVYYLYLPIGQQLKIRDYRIASFPTLGDFEKPEDSELWSFYVDDSRERIVRVKTPVFSGERSLQVQTQPYVYSGVYYTGVKQDWSSYKELQMQVYNPTKESLYVSIRVDDHGNTKSFKNRFNTTLEVAPGWQALSIPTAEIALGEGARRVDLKSIFRLYVYTSKSQVSNLFYLDQVKLLK